jgi:hypothetical protein
MDNTITMKNVMEDITEVNILFIYINSSNEVESVMKNKWTFSQPNLILKSEVIDILKKYISNQEINMNTYTISSILQYNVDLPAIKEDNIDSESYDNEYEGWNNELIKEYINYCYDDFLNIPFLNIIKNIRDIYWKPTLSLLKELNELIIIFYANRDIKYSSSLSMSMSTNKNITRRINIQTNKYKTTKKYYKK